MNAKEHYLLELHMTRMLRKMYTSVWNILFFWHEK